MSSKTFLILGATGATGIQLIQVALSKSHRVVLYVRNPSKVPAGLAENANVTIVTGSLDDSVSLEQALKNVDAVISLLGPTGRSIIPTAQYYPVILRAMRASGLKRLVYTSTPAVAQPDDRTALSTTLTLFFGRLAFPKGLQNFVDTHKAVAEEGSDIDWTEVRVGILQDDHKVGEKLHVGYIGAPAYRIFISRQHIAEFMMEQAEKMGSESSWIRKSPTIWTS